jgi:hypothetical protein
MLSLQHLLLTMTEPHAVLCMETTCPRSVPVTTAIGNSLAAVVYDHSSPNKLESTIDTPVLALAFWSVFGTTVLMIAKRKGVSLLYWPWSSPLSGQRHVAWAGHVAVVIPCRAVFCNKHETRLRGREACSCIVDTTSQRVRSLAS